jgi:hypothetical protein
VQIEVLTSVWGADDQEFPGGVHDVKLTRKLAPLVAGAEAAGAIVVVDATSAERKLLERHVQSQEQAEKAQAKAMGDPDPETGSPTGPWQHGNHVDFVAQAKARLHADDPDARLTAAERAALERDVAEAQARLEAMEPPT